MAPMLALLLKMTCAMFTKREVGLLPSSCVLKGLRCSREDCERGLACGYLNNLLERVIYSWPVFLPLSATLGPQTPTRWFDFGTLPCSHSSSDSATPLQQQKRSTAPTRASTSKNGTKTPSSASPSHNLPPATFDGAGPRASMRPSPRPAMPHTKATAACSTAAISTCPKTA